MAWVGKPYTGLWIREYLKRVGMDYEYNIWRTLVKTLAKYGYKYPSYQSFRKYMRVLRKLNLVRVVKEEHRGYGFPRRYYALVPENIDRDDLWINPQKALYGIKVALGRRRYRKLKEEGKI